VLPFRRALGKAAEQRARGGIWGSDRTHGPQRIAPRASGRDATLDAMEPGETPLPRPLRIALWALLPLSLIVLIAYAGSLLLSEEGRAPLVTVRALASYPHDPTAFTQGLLLHAGVLYESTGLYGRSRLRATDPTSGRQVWARRLPARLFGEGLARRSDGTLVQLTWREEVALLWRGPQRRGQVGYEGEGWGLTRAGDVLVMSDGSDLLTLRDPQTLRPCGVIRVRDGGRAVAGLNELEWVAGEIWANVWPSDRIAVIDPRSGQVRRVLDLSGLRRDLPAGEVDVLNGIAWDPARRQVLVTGKLWPRLFAIAAPGPTVARGLACAA